jgi:hypothetical protein
LKFGVEVLGNGTRWWSAVGGYLRYATMLLRSRSVTAAHILRIFGES